MKSCRKNELGIKLANKNMCSSAGKTVQQITREKINKYKQISDKNCK